MEVKNIQKPSYIKGFLAIALKTATSDLILTCIHQIFFFFALFLLLCSLLCHCHDNNTFLVSGGIEGELLFLDCLCIVVFTDVVITAFSPL